MESPDIVEIVMAIIIAAQSIWITIRELLVKIGKKK